MKQLDRKNFVIVAFALSLVGIIAGMYLAGKLPAALAARLSERTDTVKTVWSVINGNDKTTTTRTVETIMHSHDGLPMHKHVVTVIVAVTETTPHETFHDFPATQTAAPVAGNTSGHVMAPGDAGQGQQVLIIGREFMPATITVSPGTKVTWSSKENEVHTVTSDAGLFNGLVITNGSFSFTFADAGTYKYHCDNRPEMTGTVIVK